MALFRIEQDVPGGFNPNTPNVSYGRPGDYSLSSCGGYWLSRSGIGESPLSGPTFERLLGMPATVRNITTVRKLAAKLHKDIALRVLAAENYPAHRTL